MVELVYLARLRVRRPMSPTSVRCSRGCAAAAAPGRPSSHPGAPCASRSITTSREPTLRCAPETKWRSFPRWPEA